MSLEFPERDVRTGYAAWSETYDEPGNPLIYLEETSLVPLLDKLPPGRALDAACGTGRHARLLVDRGHEVIGVDTTPEMLERAREKVPEADFRDGDLADLPVDDMSVDLAVCGLAFDHLPDIGPAVHELVRVVRAGGRVIVSDVHPFLLHLGVHAGYRAADDTWGFVRSHVHSHGDYLNAFGAASLVVEELLEPQADQRWLEMQAFSWPQIPEALPMAIIWALRKPEAA